MYRFASCGGLFAALTAVQAVDGFAFSETKQRQHNLRKGAHSAVVLFETTPQVDAGIDSDNNANTSTDAGIDVIVDSINELYPPMGLDERIALSRKDGYWPYIASGEDPPQELVYGEFEVRPLQQALERSLEALFENNNNNDDDNNNKKTESEIVFCDLGSGTGRLVLSAAALYPHWKLCRGLELLETIHQEALKKVESCRRSKLIEEMTPEDPSSSSSSGMAEAADSVSNVSDGEINDDDVVQNDDYGDDDNDNDNDNDNALTTSEPEFFLNPSSDHGPLPLAPIQLDCGSFTNPYGSFGDADIIFCFSTCLPDHIRIDLARSIGRQCKPGTIVITTDYELPSGGVLEALPDDPDYPTGRYEIEVVDSFSGACSAVGGESTVYIQRVLRSLGTGIPRVQPELPLSEIAYRAIVQTEETKNDRGKAFLRQVSNQMVFLGFPDSWRPKV